MKASIIKKILLPIISVILGQQSFAAKLTLHTDEKDKNLYTIKILDTKTSKVVEHNIDAGNRRNCFYQDITTIDHTRVHDYKVTIAVKDAKLSPPKPSMIAHNFYKNSKVHNNVKGIELQKNIPFVLAYQIERFTVKECANTFDITISGSDISDPRDEVNLYINFINGQIHARFSYTHPYNELGEVLLGAMLAYNPENPGNPDCSIM
ncbi:MAG: hypothetical protein HRT87_10275 [Legionellales bacterium]|nr:hypothetical protein [Legionellales bacterium]